MGVAQGETHQALMKEILKDLEEATRESAATDVTLTLDRRRFLLLRFSARDNPVYTVAKARVGRSREPELEIQNVPTV